MSTKDKIIQKVLSAPVHSITFVDFAKGLTALGYKQDHTTGSHQIWVHKERDLSLNIQPKGKMAKPYQIKQFRQQWTH